MTYRSLYEKAEWKLEKGEITCEEFDEMTKPLDEEIRQHGEWIKSFDMDKATVCSECGEEAWYKEYRGWVTKSNFCPNCGADMRGEKK